MFLTPKYLGIVMEFIDGVDLTVYLGAMGGRLSEDFSRFIFQQLILALAFCHGKGKGHRDIKLANVRKGRAHRRPESRNRSESASLVP